MEGTSRKWIYLAASLYREIRPSPSPDARSGFFGSRFESACSKHHQGQISLAPLRCGSSGRGCSSWRFPCWWVLGHRFLRGRIFWRPQQWWGLIYYLKMVRFHFEGLKLLIKLKTRICGDLSGVISRDFGKRICWIWVTMSEWLRLFPSRSVTICGKPSFIYLTFICWTSRWLLRYSLTELSSLKLYKLALSIKNLNDSSSSFSLS